MGNNFILNQEITMKEFMDVKKHLSKVLDLTKDKVKEKDSRRILDSVDGSLVLHPEISFVVNWDLAKPPTLEEAQEIVGGFVEMAIDDDEKQCLVNEEGLLLRLAFNELASKLCKKPIVGTALVLKGDSRWMD
tara:strand:- start:40 stop:438 length:399 start_codon:yes stop_codon:yes gene_type:complete